MRRHGWESRRQKGEEETAEQGGQAAAPGRVPSTLQPSTQNQFPVAADVPQAEIPELQKKEKDKKGGGFSWETASPTGGGALARAATGPGWTSPLGLGRLAASIAQRLGAQSFLGTLLLSKAGGWLLLGSIVGGGIGLGVAAGLSLRPPAPRMAASGSPNLEGPSSTIVLNGPKDKSLGYVARANQGEIVFEDKNPMAPKAESAESPEPKAPEPAAGMAMQQQQQQATADAPASGLANDSANQLSTKLGQLAQQTGGSFGGGGGLPAMKALNGGFQLKQPSALPSLDKNHQKLTGFKKTAARMSASNMSGAQGHASKAMGQLKMAKYLSSSAAGMSGSEGQKQYASNAFDQQNTQGGELAAPIANDGVPQVVVPPGSGAPDTTSVTPAAPDVGPTQDAIPNYQGAQDMAKALAQMAGMLRMIGIIMMVAGAALVAAGLSSTPVGWWLVAAGVALIAVGVMMMAAAQNMAKQAGQIGQQAADQGQTQQGDINKKAADAKANGTDYTPPDMTKKLGDNAELHQKVSDERNATYNLPGAGGDPNNTANGGNSDGKKPQPQKPGQ